MKNYELLNKIHSPNDLKQLPEDIIPDLAEELRSAMIETVSQNGGHLASSLGAVEIIIALHRVFSVPEDTIVFDVGHQAYAHKILTGRWDEFRSLRLKNGISGFPKREESIYDAFNTGHASTSISAALGYARAFSLQKKHNHSIAVIGDGALTGGLALEAMNDAGQAKVPLIVVLNDNEMSISRNVGALHKQLMDMRTSRKYVSLKRKVSRALDTGAPGKWLSAHMGSFKKRIKNFLLPDLLFEQMGFTYIGPIDGHDEKELERVFERARSLNGAVLIHTITKKGKGYSFAEKDPELFHGVAPFDIKTGIPVSDGKKKNSDYFSETLFDLAREDTSIVAITAAMRYGTGLTGFSQDIPERFFDVGIAEEHAVTMAAGMAAGGLKPVLCIYSSFLQRAYDQIYHDVALQNLPIVIGVDRAGLVGNDGETHQGVLDVAMVLKMPNIAVYSPASVLELTEMLKMALTRTEPAVIRYPRKTLYEKVPTSSLEFGRWEVIKSISRVTVIATGSMVEIAEQAISCLDSGVGFVNARFIRPYDDFVIEKIKTDCETIITIEDGVVAFGDVIRSLLPKKKVITMGVSINPVKQGTIIEQREECGLTAARIIEVIKGEQ